VGVGLDFPLVLLAVLLTCCVLPALPSSFRTTCCLFTIRLFLTLISLLPSKNTIAPGEPGRMQAFRRHIVDSLHAFAASIATQA